MAEAGTVLSQATVLSMRAISSASVFSVFSYLGASRPLMRAAHSLAASQAMQICVLNGSMSGARRYCTSACSS